VNTCETGHRNCSSSPAEEPLLPARVIDADPEHGDNIRILLQEDAGQQARYLALSHRWVSGPMPPWVTRRDNLQQRKLGISLNALPATVVDAIRVARSLGIKFVWIDSLCILQDSSEDWDIESSRMASIYANAYITLFADCGRDDDHGFLCHRNPYPSTHITFTAPDGGPVDIYLRKSSEDGTYKATQFASSQSDLETSHLSDRGWIFQERVLSRRILHFTQSKLYWECNEGTFGEDGYTVLKKGLRECGQHDLRFCKLSYGSIHSSVALPPGDFAQQWVRLVQAYSTLNLTKADDKLPAMAGLAAALHSRASADEGGRYFAGVWEKGLAQHLAWSITNTKPEAVHRVYQFYEYSDGSSGGRLEKDSTFVHPGQLSPRPPLYRAPSFSWAAVDGEISFHKLTKPCITFQGVKMDTPASNPYGKPNSIQMTVSSPLRQAWCCGPFEKDFHGAMAPRRAGYTPLYYYDTGLPFGYLLYDSSDDADARDVFCLKIGEPSYSGNIFLVLVRHGAAEAPVSWFRRIGLGYTRDKCSDFFEDAEAKTVTLV